MKSKSMLRALLLVVALPLHLAAPQVALAAWPVSGLGICQATGTQQHPSITSDGASGAIIAWEDFRTQPNLIAAQHVLAGGDLDPNWPHFGRVMMVVPLVNPDGGQFAPVIVADRAGGAIVAWQDNRSADTETDIFAQHVLASGEVDEKWPATGVPLCTARSLQEFLTMTSDGSGGAIATWVDSRAGANEFDIFAQHVLDSGVVDPAWPENGVAVCNANGPQGFPIIVGDGLGGALITWHDFRAGALGFDVYAQHVLGSGVVDPAWPANGRALCAASGDQGRPSIATDGAHGAIVVWSDSRVVGTSHIFAQHVRANGTVDPAWPFDGRAISNAGLLETRALVVPDGAGGVIVNWQAFTEHIDMLAQHVTAAGIVDPAWPANGRLLSQHKRQQTHAEIAADGEGGAVVAWDDSFDIVANHVLSTGAIDPAYNDSARVLCNLPSQQGDPAIISTGGDGAIVTWTDGRAGGSGTGVDIFALQVLAATPTAVPDRAPPAIAFAPAFPNPARNSMTLQFVLPQDESVRLSIYDVAGRRVRVLATGARPAGANMLAWDMRDEQGLTVGSGVYFARLEANHHVVTQKLIRLR
jgi:hypothetical protein